MAFDTLEDLGVDLDSVDSMGSTIASNALSRITPEEIIKEMRKAIEEDRNYFNFILRPDNGDGSVYISNKNPEFSEFRKALMKNDVICDVYVSKYDGSKKRLFPDCWITIKFHKPERALTARDGVPEALPLWRRALNLITHRSVQPEALPAPDSNEKPLADQLKSSLDRISDAAGKLGISDLDIEGLSDSIAEVGAFLKDTKNVNAPKSVKYANTRLGQVAAKFAEHARLNLVTPGDVDGLKVIFAQGAEHVSNAVSYIRAPKELDARLGREVLSAQMANTL